MVCEECEPETHLLTISQRERERERDKLNKLAKLGDSNKLFTHTKSKFVSWWFSQLAIGEEEAWTRKGFEWELRKLSPAPSLSFHCNLCSEINLRFGSKIVGFPPNWGIQDKGT